MLRPTCWLIFVLVMLQCQAVALADECADGKSNYTQEVWVQTNMSEKVKIASSQMMQKKCWGSWWWKKCSTQYRIVYKDGFIYKTYSKKDYNITCCHGYFNMNGSCESDCPSGKYGENCTYNCSCTSNAYQICEKEHGNCTCKPGWKGDNCTEDCDVGFYGNNCESNCACKNNATCDRSSGCNCTSVHGWMGEYCETECQNNTFGINCNENCTCGENQLCNPVEGNCTCKPGWAGDNCTNPCSNYTYGDGCLDNCTCNTAHADGCDNENGECNCTSGYMGNCSDECPFGYHGKHCSENCSHCNNTEYCDPVNGSCLCVGSTGDNCTVECNATTYGIMCGMTCNCNTTHSNGTCDPFSGACHCQPGWTGWTCENKCQNNTFGINCNENCTCGENQLCNPVDGNCTCKPGWAGDNCTIQCKNNTFGINCNENCTCGENQLCNPVEGNCTCKPGWVGDNCTNQCQNNTFGINCNKNCMCEENQLCNPVEGNCICKPGLVGDNCTNHMTPDKVGGDEYSAIVIMVAITVPCALLVLIVVTAIAIVVRKNRQFKPKQKVSSEEWVMTENPVYDFTNVPASRQQSMVETVDNNKCTPLENENEMQSINYVSLKNITNENAEIEPNHYNDTDTYPERSKSENDLNENKKDIKGEENDATREKNSEIDEPGTDIYNKLSYTKPKSEQNSDYNTFGDVRKLQQKESIDEEDYDLLEHSHISKKVSVKVKGYSTLAEMKQIITGNDSNVAGNIDNNIYEETCNAPKHESNRVESGNIYNKLSIRRKEELNSKEPVSSKTKTGETNVSTKQPENKNEDTVSIEKLKDSSDGKVQTPDINTDDVGKVDDIICAQDFEEYSFCEIDNIGEIQENMDDNDMANIYEECNLQDLDTENDVQMEKKNDRKMTERNIPEEGTVVYEDCSMSESSVEVDTSAEESDDSTTDQNISKEKEDSKRNNQVCHPSNIVKYSKKRRMEDYEEYNTTF